MNKNNIEMSDEYINDIRKMKNDEAKNYLSALIEYAYSQGVQNKPLSGVLIGKSDEKE